MAASARRRTRRAIVAVSSRCSTLRGRAGRAGSVEARRSARSVVFTENGQRLELGDGLWHTVTGARRLRAAPRRRRARPGGADGHRSARPTSPPFWSCGSKVARRRIDEIETLVIRNEAAAKSLDSDRHAARGLDPGGAGRRASHARRPRAHRQHVFLGHRAQRRASGGIRLPTRARGSRTAP